MKNHLVMAGTIVAALAIPLAANAQNNATTGAVGGAVGGAIVGGPVGAVVGGVGGAIVGGIADDRRSQFHTYVVQEKRASYRYNRDVVVGAELPSSRRHLLRGASRIRRKELSIYGRQRPHRAGRSAFPPHRAGHRVINPARLMRAVWERSGVRAGPFHCILYPCLWCCRVEAMSFRRHKADIQARCGTSNKNAST